MLVSLEERGGCDEYVETEASLYTPMSNKLV
jgi:hypothetical protein